MNDVRRACPWCGRKGLTWPLLKRHVKFCDRAPRLRGRVDRGRMVVCSSRKARHYTKESASRHMAKLAELGGVALNVYRCQECGFFHVGTMPRELRHRLGFEEHRA